MLNKLLCLIKAAEFRIHKTEHNLFSTRVLTCFYSYSANRLIKVNHLNRCLDIPSVSLTKK